MPGIGNVTADLKANILIKKKESKPLLNEHYYVLYACFESEHRALKALGSVHSTVNLWNCPFMQ